MLRCQQLLSGAWLRFIGRIFRFLPTSLLFDAPNEGNLLERYGSIIFEFYFARGKLEWLEYNLVKVAWWSTRLFGHSTSTWQTDRQTDSHVAIANAAPMHCVGSQKELVFRHIQTSESIVVNHGHPATQKNHKYGYTLFKKRHCNYVITVVGQINYVCI